MNERFRELARRVVGKHHNDIGSISLFDQQIDQFAEMIVRECIAVIRHEVTLKYKDSPLQDESMEDFKAGHYAGSVLARVKIKHRFGVEE